MTETETNLYYSLHQDKLFEDSIINPVLAFDGKNNLLKTGWMGVYMWQDPNGIQYVGKSKDLKSRIKCYLDDETGKSNRFLYQAFLYHGIENMRCYILAAWEYDKYWRGSHQLSDIEMKHIVQKGSYFPYGYNLITPGINNVPIISSGDACCRETHKRVRKIVMKIGRDNDAELYKDIFGSRWPAKL